MRRRLGWAWLAGAGVLAACTGPGAGDAAPATTGAPGTPVEVTVDGPVQRVVARHVFEVGSGPPSPVTVVWPDRRREVRVGVLVRATGTVTPFDVRTFEREFAIDLDDARVADLEGTDVLMARQLVLRTPEGGTAE